MLQAFENSRRAHLIIGGIALGLSLLFGKWLLEFSTSSSQSEFEYAKARMVEIYSEYDDVPYNLHPAFKDVEGELFVDRYQRVVEFAREHQTGQCRMRSNVLSLMVSDEFGHEFEYLDFGGEHYRSVGMFNTPNQLNHSAIDLRVDGIWAFFDPSFGIYFTNLKGTPIGFAEARAVFPKLLVHKFDKHAPNSWTVYGPHELMGEPIKLWSVSDQPDTSFVNGNLQRLYFSVDAVPDAPRRTVFRSGAEFEPASVTIADSIHTEVGIFIPESGINTIVIEGNGLEYITFDIDPLEHIAQTFEESVIHREFLEEGKLKLSFNAVTAGSILKMRPTTLGNAHISAVALIENGL